MACSFVHPASGLWPSQSVHTTTNVCQMASCERSALCTIRQGYGLPKLRTPPQMFFTASYEQSALCSMRQGYGLPKLCTPPQMSVRWHHTSTQPFAPCIWAMAYDHSSRLSPWEASVEIAEKRTVFLSFLCTMQNLNRNGLRHKSCSAYKGRDSMTGSLGRLRVGEHESQQEAEVHAALQQATHRL